MKLSNLVNRYTLRELVIIKDVESVRNIVSSTGFFSHEEILIAVELVKERLNKGESSGYSFLFLEFSKQTIGYSCFGPIPGTKLSYDLYWIAVHKDFQSKGLGKILLEESEQMIHRMGGRRIYIETSGRKQYESTRKFYLANNYKQEAVLADFYAPEDSKILYLKVV